jgi:anti-sigma factor RsiW
MTCREMEALLDPYFDGELDALRCREVDEHLGGCTACAETLDRRQALREAIRKAPYYRAPAGIGLPRRSTAWRPVVALALAACVLALIVTWRLLPRQPSGIAAEVASAHVRSLEADHLLDVASTDRHNVKPWFAGKLDFAPEVPELAGFELMGGRLDYLNGRPVAALIYKRRQHTVNVFEWPEAGAERPVRASVRGFNVVHWRRGGMEWWAVSDLNGQEVEEIAR